MPFIYELIYILRRKEVWKIIPIKLLFLKLNLRERVEVKVNKYLSTIIGEGKEKAILKRICKLLFQLNFIHIMWPFVNLNIQFKVNNLIRYTKYIIDFNDRLIAHKSQLLAPYFRITLKKTKEAWKYSNKSDNFSIKITTITTIYLS